MATRDLDRLGDRVKSHRLALYPSRQAAAAAAGITKDTWQRVEEGRPVRDTSYAKIDAALGWAAGSCLIVAEGGEPLLGEAGAATPVHAMRPTEGAVRSAVLEAATAKLSETPIGQVQEFADELVEVLRRAGVVQTDG
ncbi:helix-turn-helix domain-containing protein [Streptomyces acidiscabies]|uniref:helix-turn-helix domain-containing protein n=1 Tax=Streptomyces acidiscabies TaxID=42234 RepID=UPI0009520777|nr:helix-turn-helix domain-containing protein [Streptomyces acidiscabies]